MNYRNKFLKLFYTLFFLPKIKDSCLFIFGLIINNDVIDDGGYKVYSGGDAVSVCDKYVLSQKFFIDDVNKDILDLWSSRYFQGLNEYIRGLITPSMDKIEEYEEFREDLSSLIKSTKGLEVNTILFRGEKEVDIESRFRIGEKNKFVGFIATSFSYQIAKKFSYSLNHEGYVIKIKAKKNTKGIAINGKDVGSFKNQKEWLLDENQEYITKTFDEKNKIIEIELL